ncbi:MAG: hypothetical protein ACYC7D_07295 [Nitrososphaerales archaeon]
MLSLISIGEAAGVGCGTFLLIMTLFVNVYASLISALAVGILEGFAGISWLSAAQMLVRSDAGALFWGRWPG